jgi:hypothetical protein
VKTPGGIVQRGIAVLVSLVHQLRGMVEELGTDASVATGRCIVEGRGAVVVFGINACTCTQQGCNALCVAVEACQMEGRVAIRALQQGGK